MDYENPGETVAQVAETPAKPGDKFGWLAVRGGGYVRLTAAEIGLYGNPACDEHCEAVTSPLWCSRVRSVTVTPQDELVAEYSRDSETGRIEGSVRYGGRFWLTDGAKGQERVARVSRLPVDVLEVLELVREEVVEARAEVRGAKLRVYEEVVRPAMDDIWRRAEDTYRLTRHKYVRSLRDGQNHKAQKPAALEGVRHVQPYVPPGGFVYFLLLDGAVVYVGQTIDLPGRIACHEKEKTFDDVWCIPCDVTSLLKVEAAYIKRFDPPLNKAGTERNRTGKGVRRGATC